MKLRAQNINEVVACGKNNQTAVEVVSYASPPSSKNNRQRNAQVREMKLTRPAGAVGIRSEDIIPANTSSLTSITCGAQWR